MDIKNKLTSSFLEAQSLQNTYFTQQLQQLELLSSVIFETIVSDGKVFIYGQGLCSFLSDIAVSYAIGCYQTDRIPLPMVSLQANSTILHAAHAQYGLSHSLARQLDAISTSQDTLVTFDLGSDIQGLTELIQVAQNKEMRIICITSEISALLIEHLRADSDLILMLPNAQPARLIEQYLFLLNQVIETVDAQLIGEL